jgi:hypothetical protein
LRFCVLLGVLLAGAIAPIAFAAQTTEPDRVTVRPSDDGRALVNLGMGWVLYFYSDFTSNYGSKLEPSDTVDEFPGISTVYLRVPWSMLEPEEGKFNWALFDTPAQRWIARGKRVAMRVTCSESMIRYATPEWVQKAGAKGRNFFVGLGPREDGPLWDPDFADPVFLAKLENFLKAMAARYDGNPNVAYIDIGSFGLWGEGHTVASSHIPQDQTREIVKRHIDLHTKIFHKTQLAISDDVAGPDTPGDHFPETDYALAHGVTLRDDSIMVWPPPKHWYHAEMAQAFWPKLPVILEHDHLGSAEIRKAWDGDRLLKAVEDYHASYLSIHWWPKEYLAKNRATIDKINRRIGYRLQLREMSWPKAVTIGQPFKVESTWANAGVAPCLPGGFVALTLKDAKGGIVSVLSDEGFDVRALEVGKADQVPTKSRSCEFTVGQFAPVTQPGEYDVYVSIGQRDGTPTIALPLPDDDGQHRYKLGRITLRNP